jgi:hypothetical protein
MANADKIGDNKVFEVAKSLGYDPTKSKELEKCITRILELDLWDISKILFFGRTWGKY